MRNTAGSFEAWRIALHRSDHFWMRRNMRISKEKGDPEGPPVERLKISDKRVGWLRYGTVGTTANNPLGVTNSRAHMMATELDSLSIADGADVESLRRHRDRRCAHRSKPESADRLN